MWIALVIVGCLLATVPGLEFIAAGAISTAIVFGAPSAFFGRDE